MAEQLPFADVEAANNPEPRCACVLLLDTSGSMGEVVADSGRDLGYTIQQDGQTYQAVSGGTTRISLLNEGLKAYHADLMKDSLAQLRVDVTVITFGGSVQTVTPFVTAHQFTPPTLTANGDTPMGDAILKGIDAVTERKRYYRDNALQLWRPWIFLITDGEPTDGERWKQAAAKVQEGEKNKSFTFFAVGVEGANFNLLKQITPTREPLKLKGYSFREMFLWLSSSQKKVSQSKPGQSEDVQLAPVTWGSVSV